MNTPNLWAYWVIGGRPLTFVERLRVRLWCLWNDRWPMP